MFPLSTRPLLALVTLCRGPQLTLAAATLLAVCAWRAARSDGDAPSAPSTAASASDASAVPRFTLPLLFEENRGQGDPAFPFVARAGALRLALAPDRALLAPASAVAQPVAIVLEGARAATPLVGEERQPTLVRYQLGRTAAARPASATFARLRSIAPWPGIDVVWHASGTQLEYDFVLAPEAAAESIALRFEGASGARLTEDGALLLDTPHGVVAQPPPATYELDDDGARHAVDARWQLLASAADGAPRAGFALGPRDERRALVIDPVVGFLSLLGGPGFGDEATALHVGPDYLLLAGVADGASFPRGQGGDFVPAAGGRDGFLARFDATGRILEQLTYFGGAGEDEITALAVDAAGEIAVCGDTDSLDLPVLRASGADFVLQESYGGGLGDAFLARFAPDFELLAASYLGGGERDEAAALAWLADGALAVTGSTQSSDFPLQSPDQASIGGGQAGFLARVDARLEAFHFSTFVATSGSQTDLHALIETSDGALVVAGGTYGGTFDRESIFLRRFDAAGDAQASMRFANDDPVDAQSAWALCELDDGRLALAGETSGAILPSNGPPAGAADACVAIVDRFLLGIDFTERFGGSSSDYGRAIAARADRLFVGGFSSSSDLPSVAPLYAGSSESNDLALLASFDLATAPPAMDLLTALPMVEEASLAALHADPQADGALWLAGSVRSRGPALALRATGPVEYVTSGEDHDPFLMRLDFGPPALLAEYGHVRVLDSATLSDEPTEYEFFVERRGDATTSQEVIWELRDADTQALLDSGVLPFAPGLVLAGAVATLARATDDVEIWLAVEGVNVGLLPGKEVLHLAIGASGGDPYDGDEGNGDGGGSSSSGSGGGSSGGWGGFIVNDCACVRIVGELRGGGRGLDALRALRDRVLARFDAGRRFTSAYYEWSARAVPWLDDHPVVLALLRVTVGPLIALLGMPWLVALLLAAWWGRGALRNGLRRLVAARLAVQLAISGQTSGATVMVTAITSRSSSTPTRRKSENL